jgi:hypothetical protein
MAHSVCLFASSGRVSRSVTTKNVVNPTLLPMHLTPSDNAKYLGSLRYEPKPVGERPEGFESFPKPDLHDPDNEVGFNEEIKIEAVAKVQKPVKAKHAWAL